MTRHCHKCACCGSSWECQDEEDGGGAIGDCCVAKAAKVNKDGPFCPACFHGVMFVRYANQQYRNFQHQTAQALLELIVKREQNHANT